MVEKEVYNNRRNVYLPFWCNVLRSTSLDFCATDNVPGIFDKSCFMMFKQERIFLNVSFVWIFIHNRIARMLIHFCKIFNYKMFLITWHLHIIQKLALLKKISTISLLFGSRSLVLYIHVSFMFGQSQKSSPITLIASTQITNMEIFVFIDVLVSKLLSREVLLINRKENRNC